MSKRKDVGLLMLTALLSLVMLGMAGWQLSRAEEKRQLIVEWQQRRNSDISLNQASAMDSPFGYRLATQGRYLSGREVFLDNQIQAGRVGYRLIRALLTPQGLLMVDTGWWAAEVDRRQLPAIPAITTSLSLSGHLVRPYQPPLSLGQFTFIASYPLVPSLTPALLTQIWGEPVLPFVLKLSSDEQGTEDEPWQPVVMGPEKHIGYAVQWLLMALAVCIAAFCYYRRRDAN